MIGSKKGTVTSKPLKRISAYPTDAEGRPVLPLKLGIMTLVNLGTIVWDNPAFHNSRYIYPVGFETTRVYASAKNPNKNATYTCRIKNVDGSPRVSEGSPEHFFNHYRPSLICAVV